MQTHISHSPEDTRSFAHELAHTLHGGNIVTLRGELGSGKTACAKYIAEALDIHTDITSPTFTLMNVYPVAQHPSIKTLVHIDTYRMKSAREAIDIGIDEYIDAPDTLMIIEWPELLGEILDGHHTIDVSITHTGESTRKITINQ